MADFRSIVGRPGALIGMVHVGALPGTPRSVKGVRELAAAAADEARTLEGAGFDAIIVENMHDVPYVHGARVGPEIVAAMTRIVSEVRAAVNVPMGVQVLSGGAQQALAVAHACGAGFIRVENFVFSHIAEEGLLSEGEAGTLLRYRKAIGADEVAILADIDKKHASHAITADLPLADWAHAAEYFLADGVIVTGRFTGKPPTEADLASAKAACEIPVVVGSGATPPLLGTMLKHADAVIVGTAIKQGGDWKNPVDAARAKAFVAEADKHRR